MAFPSYATPTATQFAISVTSMSVNLPGSIAAGDLLLTWVSVRYPVTWSNVPSGWTQLGQQTGGGSASQLTVFYKIASGSEGSTAGWVSSTPTTAVWQSIKVTNWHGSTAPAISTGASGDASAANPPSVSPSWGADDTLFIAIAGHAAASAAAFTAAPSGYSGFLNSGASSGGSAVSVASAYRQINASSEDPGAFTAGGSNRYWAAFTVAVRPAATGASTISPGNSSHAQTATGTTVQQGFVLSVTNATHAHQASGVTLGGDFPPPELALLQYTHGNSGGYNNANAQTFTATVSAGSLLVVGLVAGSADTVASVTDNRGNTYHLAEAVDTNERGLWLYYAENANAGSTTVTVAFNGGQYPDSIVFLREYSGIVEEDALDVTSKSTNTTNFIASHTTQPSASTNQGPELVVVVGGSAGSSNPGFAAGSGYGNLDTGSGSDVYTYGLVEDRFSSSVGSQTGTYTSVANVVGGAVLATFRRIAAGDESIDLEAADTVHTQTSQSASIDQYFGIAASNATHSQSSSAPALIQQQVIAPANATHSQSSGQPPIARIYSLTPASPYHGQAVGQPSIVQTYSLAPVSTSQAQTAAQPSTSIQFSLAGLSTSHSQSATQPSIGQRQQLSSAGTAHLNSAGQPNLTQTPILSPQTANHGHLGASPALAQQQTLGPATAIHGTTASAPATTPSGALAPATAFQSQVATSPTLTQQQVLSPATALHVHHGIQPGISASVTISAADAAHSHAPAQPSLTQSLGVVPKAANHSHKVSTPTLTPLFSLPVQSAQHAVTASEAKVPADHGTPLVAGRAPLFAKRAVEIASSRSNLSQARGSLFTPRSSATRAK